MTPNCQQFLFCIYTPLKVNGVEPKHVLGGGFNPFEKYESNWKSSPNRGEHKKYLKTPPKCRFGSNDFPLQTGECVG